MFSVEEWSFFGCGLAVVLLVLVSKSFFLQPTNETKVFGATALHAKVLKKAPKLSSVYCPPWYLQNPHVQIVLSFLLPHPNLAYDREFLQMEDGGSVALDWTQQRSDQPNTPIVVVFHGLTGGSPDMKRFCHLAQQNNFRAVVFNKRGHGGTTLSTPFFQQFGCVSDITHVLNHIQKKYPLAPLVGVGYSAGSGLLCSYLGETGEKSAFKATVLISPGYDAFQLFCNEGAGIKPIYNWLMTFSLKGLLFKHKKSLQNQVNFGAAMKATSIKEFHQHVDMKMHGYDSIKDYWVQNNPMRNYANIQTPVLCINALDDPVCTEGMIAYNAFEEYAEPLLVTTTRGGHCGFFESIFNVSSWADSAAIEYLLASLDYCQ